jgi:ribosomal peptide maturation radical SAM protein 1
MPLASANYPSIQIGLLSAIGKAQGFEVDTHHLNLDFAALIGPDLYERLCEHRGRMTGEWLFSHAAFGDELQHEAVDYLRAFPEEQAWIAGLDHDADFLLHLRKTVIPNFIDACFHTHDWAAYAAIGFTSTFQQSAASLALAKRIKAAHPAITIIFGGANMEGAMGAEYARAFDFVDFVVSGEGDAALPALLHLLSTGRGPKAIRGVISRSDAHRERTPTDQAAPVIDLDSLPTPDYQEFFTRAEALGIAETYARRWSIPFESSRGCWWGQKHHCTFCGLNGLGMAYRSKSSSKVLGELAELAHRHHNLQFTAVDNILSTKYIDTLFPKIADGGFDYGFFYEVKANLKKEQIYSLKKGGVNRLQPGLESMSTHVLQLMRKGCSMLQNVRFLKWCLYYGIEVNWNIIWGFPGETEHDYEQQLRVLAQLAHFQPPQSCGRIWLERFSPFFSHPESFGISAVTPERSYEYVFPPHVKYDDIAYFFAYEAANTQPEAKHEELKSLLLDWRRSWYSECRHVLSYRRMPNGLLVDVDQGDGRRVTHLFQTPIAEIYEACGDSARTPKQVLDDISQGSRPVQMTLSEQNIEEILADLCSINMTLREDNQFLSLAIPENRNWSRI